MSTALRSIRQLYNIRQTDLAKAVGITQSALSQIERGELRPSQELANKITLAVNKIRLKPVEVFKKIERKEKMTYNGSCGAGTDALRSALSRAVTRDDALRALASSNVFARLSLLQEAGCDQAVDNFADDMRPEATLTALERAFSVDYLKY